MAVAKSFKNFEMLSEPFEQNNKMYVIVRNPKTQHERTVRWYTSKEYAKLYPEEKPITQGWENLKNCLGFNKGYITIFKNASYDDEWCNISNARWHERWGWYIVSIEKIPTDCPFEYAPLYWADVAKNEGMLKPKEEIEQIIFSIFYDNSPSQYLGNIGDRIELEVEIISIEKVETAYGVKAKYTLCDEKGNMLEWFTGVRKDWFRGNKKNLRGTVKELKRKYGINTTVLTRCLERK